jgi:hypothetical protein
MPGWTKKSASRRWRVSGPPPRWFSRPTRRPGGVPAPGGSRVRRADIGHVSELATFSGCDAILIESNHDIEMFARRCPESLKNRRWASFERRPRAISAAPSRACATCSSPTSPAEQPRYSVSTVASTRLRRGEGCRKTSPIPIDPAAGRGEAVLIEAARVGLCRAD